MRRIRIRETRVTTPVGDVLAWSTNEGVCVLGWQDHRPWLETLLDRRFPSRTIEGRDDELARALKEYFDGDITALAGTELDLRGTVFQLRVWAALRSIPSGTTTSYAALASTVGSGARAVGSANGQNPVSVIVPCHRVIASNGALTGYAYGTTRKAWLLDHESAASKSRVALR